MTSPLDDEAFVQSAFSDLPEVEPSAALARQVAQLPLTHPARAKASWSFQSWWLPALGWALAAALGVATGGATLDAIDPLLVDGEMEDVVSALAAQTAEESDLAPLAAVWVERDNGFGAEDAAFGAREAEDDRGSQPSDEVQP